MLRLFIRGKEKEKGEAWFGAQMLDWVFATTRQGVFLLDMGMHFWGAYFFGYRVFFLVD